MLLLNLHTTVEQRIILTTRGELEGNIWLGYGEDMQHFNKRSFRLDKGHWVERTA